MDVKTVSSYIALFGVVLVVGKLGARFHFEKKPKFGTDFWKA